MADYQNIITEVQDGILKITINRESKLNALNQDTLREIRMAVEEGNNDASVSGMIITGAGPKAFVAGADIAEFANYNVAQGEDMGRNGHNIFNAIENSPKPIIAGVNGFALGGGCELAMSCHLRVAAENAKFGQPEVNLGIIPGYGGTQRLVQLVGKAKALELLMTGDTLSAQDALQLGLVNHVVPAESLIDKCMEILKKIQTKSPLAIARVIDCVNTQMEKDRPGFEREISLFGACFSSEDFKEGTTAFLEKRKAVFTGK